MLFAPRRLNEIEDGRRGSFIRTTQGQDNPGMTLAGHDGHLIFYSVRRQHFA
jgi:hypothetical protein